MGVEGQHRGLKCRASTAASRCGREDAGGPALGGSGFSVEDAEQRHVSISRPVALGQGKPGLLGARKAGGRGGKGPGRQGSSVAQSEGPRHHQLSVREDVRHVQSVASQQSATSRIAAVVAISNIHTRRRQGSGTGRECPYPDPCTPAKKRLWGGADGNVVTRKRVYARAVVVRAASSAGRPPVEGGDGATVVSSGQAAPRAACSALEFSASPRQGPVRKAPEEGGRDDVRRGRTGRASRGCGAVLSIWGELFGAFQFCKRTCRKDGHHFSLRGVCLSRTKTQRLDSLEGRVRLDRGTKFVAMRTSFREGRDGTVEGQAGRGSERVEDAPDVLALHSGVRPKDR